MRLHPAGALSIAALLALAHGPATAAELVDAVKSGNRAKAVALVAEKVDVTAQEADGTTALH